MIRSDGKIIGGIRPSDLPSPMGWKARQNRANERRTQREIASDGIRLRQVITDRDRARTAVNAAIEKRDRLLAKIEAAKDQLAVHRLTMLQTGVVPRKMQAITFAIEQAGALIEQAEAEIARAKSTLDAAQRRHDDAVAAHAAVEHEDNESDHDVDADAAPVDSSPRGRGRPRKA